jgi:hypothetical protein
MRISVKSRLLRVYARATLASINSGFATDGDSWLFIPEEILENDDHYSKVKKYLQDDASGIEIGRMAILQTVADSRGFHSYVLW